MSPVKKPSKKKVVPTTPALQYSNEIINFLMQHWDEVPENTKNELFTAIMANIKEGLIAFALESAIYNQQFATDITEKISNWLKEPAKNNSCGEKEDDCDDCDDEDDEDPCDDCDHEDEEGCTGKYKSSCPLGKIHAAEKANYDRLIASNKSNIDVLVEQSCATAMRRIKSSLSSQIENAVLLGMQDQFELVCEIKAKRTGEVVSSIAGALTFE